MKTGKKSLWLALLTMIALVAAACGSDAADVVDTATDAAGDAADAVEEAADDAADAVEEAVDGDDDGAMEEDAMEDDAMAEGPGAGKTVNMGRANWSSGYVQAQILHDLMEELGYEVSSPDQLEFAPDLGYQTMASGEMDFWANSWYPGHLSWWEGDLPDGTRIGDNLTRIEGSLMPGGGLQGMLVTKSWADANGVTTLDQINDDEALWSQLDTDGNGKGEFYGCPEDWTCDDIMTAQIAFAGWDNLEQTQAGYDAMFAEFLTLAQAGEPAIIYTWTPTSYLAQAIPGETTMWLSVNNDSVLDDSNPTNQEGGESYCQRCGESIGYQGLGPDTCLQGPDGCQVGWEAADIEITANSAWLADNPAAEALFNEFKPPLIDLAIAGVELNDTDGAQADVEGIAARWIEANRDLADQWVAAGMAAG
jgi:glycine betaine/proline transport system substrate-binding protein